MFSELVVAYLFFGGAGAGACVVLGLLECANIGRYGRRPVPLPFCGEGRLWGRILGRPLSARHRIAATFAVPHELMARAWPVALLLLGAGALCLLADLGRPERVLALWLAPRPSLMTLGAWALLAASLLAAFFTVAANADGPRPPLPIVLAAAVAAVVAGLVTAVYTGLLLSALPSVRAFGSALVPALFFLSSLSCGVAVVILAASLVDSRRTFASALRRLARIDGVLLIGEAALLAVFVAWLAGDSDTRAAAAALVHGEIAVLFWLVLGFAGLAVPFALERRYPFGDRRAKGLWIAFCVLLGGVALRVCVTGLAAFDVTQTPEAAFGLALWN